jgi:site-specific DNA-methyltransferase (adenine-specific)
MLADKRLVKFFDYQLASACFPTVEIKGGVSYFLWDSSYSGDCMVTTDDGSGNKTTIFRPLLEKGMDTFIRDGNLISLLYKVKAFNEKSFSDIVSANDPFGYDAREDHSSKRVKVAFELAQRDDYIPIYYNGWRSEGVGYISPSTVKRNKEAIGKYKLFIPKAWGVGNPSKDWINPFLPANNAVCTETYLMVGPFDTVEEAQNCFKYMQTRFFHLMVSFIKSTQNTMQKAYEAVPMQDFSKAWTDEMLYEKHNLD